MDLVEAAASGNIVLVLAVIVVALAGAIAYMFKLLVDELRKRAERAEGLTDQMADSFSTLATSTDKAADVAQAALDELRRTK